MSETYPQSDPGRDPRPKAIDAIVGNRIRLRRLSLAMSQQQLGEAVGAVFEQIDQYETGTKRVGACRLWDISRVLDVPLSFFFFDEPGVPADASGKPGRRPVRRTQGDLSDDDAVNRRETLDLLDAYSQIHDPELRKTIINLIHSMRSVRPGSALGTTSPPRSPTDFAD